MFNPRARAVRSHRRGAVPGEAALPRLGVVTRLAVLSVLPVVAGLVEPLPVLLRGPTVYPPVLLHGVGRQSQVGDGANRGAVQQRLRDRLLHRLLCPSEVGDGAADPRGVDLADRAW